MNLIEVKHKDRCVFFKKPDSITMLLKQFISTAPRSFSYNNIQGSESDNPIQVEDENDDPSNDSDGIDKDDLVVKRLR